MGSDWTIRRIFLDCHRCGSFQLTRLARRSVLSYTLQQSAHLAHSGCPTERLIPASLGRGCSVAYMRGAEARRRQNVARLRRICDSQRGQEACWPHCTNSFLSSLGYSVPSHPILTPLPRYNLLSLLTNSALYYNGFRLQVCKPACKPGAQRVFLTTTDRHTANWGFARQEAGKKEPELPHPRTESYERGFVCVSSVAVGGWSTSRCVGGLQGASESPVSACLPVVAKTADRNTRRQLKPLVPSSHVSSY